MDNIFTLAIETISEVSGIALALVATFFINAQCIFIAPMRFSVALVNVVTDCRVDSVVVIFVSVIVEMKSSY